MKFDARGDEVSLEQDSSDMRRLDFARPLGCVSHWIPQVESGDTIHAEISVLKELPATRWNCVTVGVFCTIRGAQHVYHHIRQIESK